MVLYKRTFLLIGLSLLGLLFAVFIASQLILAQTVQQLEVQSITNTLGAAENVLSDSLRTMQTMGREWSWRDDVRDLVRGQNKRFVQSAQNDDLFSILDVDFLFFLDNSGRLIYQRTFASPSLDSLSLPRMPLRPYTLDLGDKAFLAETSGVLMLSPQEPILFIAYPILDRDTEGRMTGTMVWGRRLDSTIFDQFAEINDLDVQLLPINDDLSAYDKPAVQKLLSSSDSYHVIPLNDQQVAGYTLITDIHGDPVQFLKIQEPRALFLAAQTSSIYFLVGLVTVGALAVWVVQRLLNRVILARITALSMAVKEIRHADNLNIPIPVNGNDELSDLALGLSDLLKALAQSRSRLQDAHDNLERRVEERTVELVETNGRLRQEVADRQQAEALLAQARDQAMAALQMKTQILANVSHDARTPLTTIMLNTEMLQKGRYGEVNDRQHQVLDRIMVGARQLLTFINNLLTEAQLTNGRVKISSTPFEPEHLINEVAAMLVPIAERKGLQLVTCIDPIVPGRLCGDPDRIKQIFINLADNAIKFTDRGTITLGLLCPDKERWALQVRDTGRGIPEEARSRIFDPFWQVDGTLTRDTNRGVGLGLSIVKQMSNLMNGEITVESTPGTGSVFTVTLPMIGQEYAEPELKPAVHFDA